jgi:SAM-dependent methyltransferase
VASDHLPPATPPASIGDFYARVETAIPELDERLHVFLEEYGAFRRDRGGPLRVLDIGCGRQALLAHAIDPADEYTGCDIVEPDQMGIERFVDIDLNQQRLAERLDGQRFDVIFCGEVVEHLFSPDALLQDLRALLVPDGLLVLSTPNLAYWVNRLLLPLGISPLFLENSAWVKLGRRLKAFGQGNKTEGHIRVFTFRAVREILELHGFELQRVRAIPVWHLPIDRFVCRWAPGFAPDVVYVATSRP